MSRAVDDEQRFQGFSADSALDFYVARDAITLSIAEAGTRRAFTELADLQALLRAAFGISVVNQLAVFDWLGWAEVWQSRIQAYEVPKKYALTFDLLSYDGGAYYQALAAAAALPSFWEDAGFNLEASGLSRRDAALVLKQRDAFAERHRFDVPLPSESAVAESSRAYQTLPPAAGEREVMARIVASLKGPSMAMRITEGTAEHKFLLADPCVTQNELLTPRSDGLSLNTPKLLALASSRELRPEGTPLAKAARRIIGGHEG